MSIKQTAVRSLAWAVLESGGLSGLLFITTLILARLLGPAEFGLAALALSVVGILNSSLLSLFHDAIVQRKCLDSDDLHAAFWASLGLGALFSTGCWLMAHWIDDIFGQPGLGPVLAWMSLSLIFTGANSVHIAKLRRDANFKAIALRTLIGRSAGAAIGIWMAFAGCGVWSLVTQQLASTIFATLLVWLSSSYRPRLRLSLLRLWELFRFGISVLAATLTDEIGSRAFIALAGYFYGTAAVGFLSISIRLVETIYFILSSGVSKVGLTLFSKRQDNLADLCRWYSFAKEYSALVILPVFAGLAACSDKIVPVVLGDQWIPIIPIVSVAATGGAFLMLRQFNCVIITAVGQPRINVFVSIFSLIILMTGMLLFGMWGIFAAIIAWAAQQLAFFPELFIIRHLLCIPIREQVTQFVAPVIASLVMVVSLLLVDTVVGHKMTDLITLMILISAGSLIYISIIYVMKPDLLRMIISLPHWFQKRGSSVPT